MLQPAPRPIAAFAAIILLLPVAIPPLDLATPLALPDLAAPTRFFDLEGPDGARVRLAMPHELATLQRAEGGIESSVLLLPGDAQRKLDPALADVAGLVRDGHLGEDGKLRVLVRGGSAAAALVLDAPRALSPLDLVAGGTTLSGLATLAALPGVERIYFDRPLELHDTESNAIVRAPAVWALDDASSQSVRGAGVVIAIIDSGVDYTHADLGGCLGPACKVIGGHDFLWNDSNPMDDHGHGTHVAGTAAGYTYGVAPDAKLLAYKVCTSGGSCWTSLIIKAITRAVADGADIISMSLGGPGTSDGPLAQAADWAVDQGVVVVSAAGNDGGYSTIGEPAASLKGIAVGATTKGDTIAYFSSRGPVYDNLRNVVGIKPDLVAPGVDIDSSVPRGTCVMCSSSGHRSASGTSMATPHVAGAAALLLQGHPAWTPAQVKAALMSGAQPLFYDARTEGTGRLDALDAYQAGLVAMDGNAFLGLDVPHPGNFSLVSSVTFRNLATSSRSVALTTQSSGFALSATPATFTLAPGATHVVSVTASGNNSALADGWHEGRLVATSGAETVVSKLSFLKEAVIHLRTDNLTQLYLWRNGATQGYLLDVPTEANLTAPPGTYDALGWGSVCTTPTVCHPGIDVVGSVHLATEAWINLSASNMTSDIAFEAPLPNGLTMLSNTSCNGGTCRDIGAATIAKDGFSSFLWTSYGTHRSWRWAPTTEWSFGLSHWYRNITAREYFHAGDATHDMTSSQTLLAGTAWDHHGGVVHLPPGIASASHFRSCVHRLNAGSFGTGFTIPDGFSPKMWWNDEADPTLTMGGGVKISPLGCRYDRQSVERQVPGFGYVLGESPVEYTNASGYHGWSAWGATPADTRHAYIAPKTFLYFGGAISSGARIQTTTHWNDPNLWYLSWNGAPGRSILDPGAPFWSGHHFGNGIERIGASHNGSTLFVSDDILSNQVKLPGPGQVRVKGVTTAEYLRNATCAGSFVASYNMTRTNATPTIVWAHPSADGWYGTRFLDTQDLALHLLPQDRSGAGIASLDVSLSLNEAHVQTWTDPPAAPDGVITLDLPELGAGAYDLRYRIVANDGAEESLHQDPAFIVGAGGCGARSPFAFALANATSAPLGTPVLLNGSKSFDPDGLPLSYAWTFEGETTTTAAPTLVVTPMAGGRECATLLVTDAGGLHDTDTVCFDVPFPPTPVAVALPARVDPDEPIEFNGSASYDLDGSIANYSWEINGSTYANSTVTLAFSEWGNYCGNLTVTDNASHTRTAMACATVNALPVAVATVTPEDAEPGDTLTFDSAGSHDPDGPAGILPIWFLWDGTMLSENSFTRIASGHGEYCALLVVEDADGSRTNDTACATVNLAPMAVATAPARGSEGFDVEFNATASSDPDGDALTYEWRDAHGTLRGAAAVIRTKFSSPGVHCLTLTARDAYNKTDTDVACVEIVRGLTVSVTANKPSYTPLDTVTLRAAVKTATGDVAPGVPMTFRVVYRSGQASLDGLLANQACTSWSGAATTDAEGIATVQVQKAFIARCLGVLSLAELPNLQEASHYRVLAVGAVGSNTGQGQTTYRVVV